MPEGNEVHRFAELHEKAFGGQVVSVAAPNGRFAVGAKLIDGKRLNAVEAYGKHLLYDFGKDRKLHIHLGIYGKFREGAMPFPAPKGALRIRMWTAEQWLELRGPTACEVIGEGERTKLIARIGPDPLRADADAAAAVARIRKSRAAIGALLMDQSVVGGIGNIYRAELLFRAKVNPFCASREVAATKLRRMWTEAKALMQAGMTDRRIVTTKPVDRPHPKGKARRGETHYVYRRAKLPCFLCGALVRSEEFVGRTLYWCPGCQKADGAKQQGGGD